MSQISRVFSIFGFVLGKQVTMGDYTERLMLQKLVYLLKSIDNSITYNFSWYHRGPYSPELTKEAYEEIKNYSDYKLDKNDSNLIKSIKNLLPDNITETNLELFASVLYLMKERKEEKLDDVLFSITSSKPWFTKEETITAFDSVKNFLKTN